MPLRFLTVFELEDGLLVLSTLVGCLVGLLIFAVVAIADLILSQSKPLNFTNSMLIL